MKPNIIKSFSIAPSTLLRVGILAILFTMPSCKKERTVTTDPYAEEDEIVRINARRLTEYPNATKEGEEAFYDVTKQNSVGTPLSGALWVYLDYTTVSFDGRFIGSSVTDSAKLYRQWSASTRYVASLKRNDENSLGKELHSILQKCREGEIVTVGMSAKAGNATGLWKSRTNESVIASIGITKVLDDPKAEEQKLIQDFLNNHSGFTLRDSVYKKVDEIGTGKVIPATGRVHFRYGAYFLDGSLIETNDETIATRYGITLPSNRTSLLSIAVKDDAAFVKGLSGVCEGETVGSKLQIVVPSAMAYKDKGKGNVRPYEPLRFEITIVNYTEL